MNNHHPWHEDLLALSVGIVVLSLALFFLKQAGIVVGGIAGLALLVNQLTPLGFGLGFMLFSAPFYGLAWLRLSRRFTINSVLCVAGMSWLSEWLQQQLYVDGLTPWLAAILAGILAGIGILVLFRHNASAGGFNVLALYCQERFGWRAGYLLLGLDLTLLGLTAVFLGVSTLLVSALSMVLMNMVIGLNHRPDRYVAQLPVSSSKSGHSSAN